MLSRSLMRCEVHERYRRPGATGRSMVRSMRSAGGSAGGAQGQAGELEEKKEEHKEHGVHDEEYYEKHGTIMRRSMRRSLMKSMVMKSTRRSIRCKRCSMVHEEHAPSASIITAMMIQIDQHISSIVSR